MGTKSLGIAKLRLDLKNPRIPQAEGQRDALQKIIKDQEDKLVALAESIVKNGLNPMDRLLVMKSEEEAGKFTVLEGNRRFAAIKILHNPTVLTDLDVRSSMQKRFEALASNFDTKSLEPLDCFEVAAREDGAVWIQQRHTGENRGRGIVDWGGVASARFRGHDPALQALDFVLKLGGLSDAEKAEIEPDFPITTLDRLLSTPDVRRIIGVELVGGKLLTGLPFGEVMRPLVRIVRDLGSGVINVTKLKLQPQMVEYANSLKGDLPDLSSLAAETVAIEDLVPPKTSNGAGASTPSGEADSASRTSSSQANSDGVPRNTRASSRQPVRKALIPRGCALNITNAKIAEIEKELRALAFATYPHAIFCSFARLP